MWSINTPDFNMVRFMTTASIAEITSNLAIPLIIEKHPAEYTGLPFLTLIQYHKNNLLVIVDNISVSELSVYSIDLCGPEQVNEAAIFAVAEDWYNNRRHQIPLSIEFSRRGLIKETVKIHRSLNIEFVTRVIGPVFYFPMDTIKSVKRRRRKPLPISIVPATET